MPVSDGELQIGFDGFGFIGSARSQAWTWDEMASGNVGANYVGFSFYLGNAVKFVRSEDWLFSDKEKLLFLIGRLKECYDV